MSQQNVLISETYTSLKYVTNFNICAQFIPNPLLSVYGEVS